MRNRRFRGRMVGAVGIFIISLLVLYVYGMQAMSESRAILAFVNAVEKEDAASAAKWLVRDRDKKKLNEAEVENLLNYLADRNLLASAIGSLQRGGDAHMPDSRVFSVVTSGKLLGIFDRHRIAVVTADASVSTNFKGAVIKVNQESVAVADSDDYQTTVGPLVPGIYELQAELDGAFGPLQTMRTVDITETDELVAVDLSLDGGMVTVEANYENAAIFINGIRTDAVTGGGDLLGPVAWDGSSMVHAELQFPWGVAGSEPKPITGKEMRVEIDPNTTALKEAVMSAVSACIRSWMEAFHRQDASLVRQLDARGRAELAESIEDYKSHGLIYEAIVKKLEFDLNSIYVQQDADGAYVTAASVRNTYDQRYYSEDEAPPAFETYTDTMTYRLVYDEGEDEWIVTGWYEEVHFDDRNLQVWAE